MINAYSIGFVLTAATVAAGVDYYDQSKRAGLTLGEMSASAYASSITDRFASAKDEKLAEQAERERKNRWRRGGQVFLPEAPEGWTRRALLEGDDSAIMPRSKTSEDESVQQSFLEQMQAKEALQKYKERAKTSWIYERGTETVFVDVKTAERAGNNSMIGLVAATLDGMSFTFGEREAGYAIIGGVNYVEQFDSEGRRPHHFRVLDATIGFGTEVSIIVHANASSEATREILSAIDYDGLNGLLPQPMPTVGNSVTLEPGLDEVKLAMDMRKMRQEFMDLRATEAQYRMSNMDTKALLVNTYAQGYGNIDGIMDITGGKQVNLGMLIEAGYRTAVASLVAGKSADEITAEVGQLVKTAVSIADAEAAAMAAREANAPAPSMSPELAAELGGTVVKADTNETDMATEDLRVTAAPLAQTDSEDSASSEKGEDRVVSKRLPEDKIRKIQEDPDNVAMRLGLAAAVKKFEGKLGLPEGSCAFSMTEYRVECDKVSKKANSGILGFINKVTGGTDTEEQARFESGEAPKRLQLSGDKGTPNQRCVGSFCN